MRNLQLHLRYTGAAANGLTRAAHHAIVDAWIATGKLPRGVQIEATDWGSGKTTEQVRRTLQVGSMSAAGCPGIVRRYHSPGVTMADYDHRQPPPKLPALWAIAGKLGLKPEWCEYHKTARGWHLTVQWNRKLGPGETVALQLLLGSDPDRELFNLSRLLRGGGRSKRWNLLFERKLA